MVKKNKNVSFAHIPKISMAGMVYNLMSSTQLKAVRWGWRTYTTDFDVVVEQNPLVGAREMPLWLSVGMAFGLVMISAFSLQLLYTTATTAF